MQGLTSNSRRNPANMTAAQRMADGGMIDPLNPGAVPLVASTPVAISAAPAVIPAAPIGGAGAALTTPVTGAAPAGDWASRKQLANAQTGASSIFASQSRTDAQTQLAALTPKPAAVPGLTTPPMATGAIGLKPGGTALAQPPTSTAQAALGAGIGAPAPVTSARNNNPSNVMNSYTTDAAPASPVATGPITRIGSSFSNITRPNESPVYARSGLDPSIEGNRIPMGLRDGGAIYVNGNRSGGRVVGRGDGTVDSVDAIYAPGEYVLPTDTAQAIGYDKLDAIKSATHTPVAEQRRSARARMADGGALTDEDRRQMVQKIPTTGYPAAPPDDGRSNTDLSRNVQNAGNALGGMGVVASIPLRSAQSIMSAAPILPNAMPRLAAPVANATNFVAGMGSGAQVAAAPVSAAAQAIPRLPAVNAALQEGAQANALAGVTRGLSNAGALLAGSEKAQAATPVAPVSQDAGAGRSIYSDPRVLGNPGPISAQAQALSAADNMAQLPAPNPKASAGNGNVNVTRQPNGVLSFSGEPNISGPVTYNAGTSGFKPSGAGVTSMPAAAMMSASPSTDAALSSARFAAAARGDMDAVRDSYFAQGQSFGGQTRESVQDDSLQRLGMSPLGTPGRAFAQKLVQSRLQEQTQRRGQDITAGSAKYTADAHASSQTASNTLARGKLEIEQAKEVRIAQLDDKIINGNPFQQRAAAGQKAALLGKGFPVSDADKVAQQQGRDTQDIFSIIESAKPLLANTTGSLVGTGIDKVGSAVGYSTEGAKTSAQLKTLQGALVSKMPKMSGPQSDKDVLLYREMAGQVGDSTIPTDQRQAALKTIRDLNEKYLPRVTSEAEAMNLPPGSTFKGPDGKIRRTAQ